MLCSQSESFPEFIPVKFRMPGTPGTRAGCQSDPEIGHNLDSRLTSLINAYYAPVRGLSFHKNMYRKLMDYIAFCKYINKLDG